MWLYVLFVTFIAICSGLENISYIIPDDGCSLFPPVYVDEQLNYHLGYYGMEIDPLCDDIEFHGDDAKETYPNEFTMCFTTLLFRDPYCALRVEIMEGKPDANPVYTFNCTSKPPMQRKICLQKNQRLFARVTSAWGYELSEFNFHITAPKVYKRFWEYSIVQAVSGIAGGTVVLCILIGLVLCHQNKGNNARQKYRRPVPMHRVQNKDSNYLGKPEATSKSSSSTTTTSLGRSATAGKNVDKDQTAASAATNGMSASQPGSVGTSQNGKGRNNAGSTASGTNERSEGKTNRKDEIGKRERVPAVVEEETGIPGTGETDVVMKDRSGEEVNSLQQAGDEKQTSLIRRNANKF